MFAFCLLMIRWLASGCTRWTISPGDDSSSWDEVVRIAGNYTALCWLGSRCCGTDLFSLRRTGVQRYPAQQSSGLFAKLPSGTPLAYQLAPLARELGVWNPALQPVRSFFDPDNVEPFCVARPPARQDRSYLSVANLPPVVVR